MKSRKPISFKSSTFARFDDDFELMFLLIDALKSAENALAIKSSLRDNEQRICQRALDACREALRQAGNRL